MTPDEAYEEALRRIHEAEETGAVELDLSGWKEGEYTGLESLTRLPPELERLTSLQELNLNLCKQLNGDLSPLAGLTSPHSPGTSPSWRASPPSNRSTSRGAISSAICPRYRASSRSDRSNSSFATSIFLRWLALRSSRSA
jgi:hypothetical protein